MADLTPEALAPLLWAAMCEDAETRYPGDPDSPRWDKLGTWGEEGEVARSGMLAVARTAIERLAPAHAALTAENEQLRQQAADFAHGAGVWVRDRITEATAALEAELAQARQAHDARAAQLTAELEEARGQLVATAAPGDTVVIAFGRRLAAQQGHDAYERFRRLAPGVNIVIADDVAAIEVHRPDAENARYRGALEAIDASPAANGHTLRALAREALGAGR